MTKEEYLKILNEAFKDFVFYPDGHYYTCKGQPVGISVTRFIEQYTNEFDSQAIAEKVAIRDNKSVQEVLAEWKAKNIWSCLKGSKSHEFAQSLWSGELYQEDMKQATGGQKMALESIKQQAKQFYEDFKDKLEHLSDEFVVGSEEYSIASAIDHLFINKLTDELVLVDYKTNTDIHKNERYAKKMKVPLHHLKDTTLNHYYIQLSIYKYLVEKYAKLKVSEIFIVWFSEENENYEILELPYLY